MPPRAREKKVSPLEKIRSIIAAWPETAEKLSHGSPTWWGGKKTFACYHDGSYDEGRHSIWIKTTHEIQGQLIEADPERFFRPKYLGPSGWVALRLEDDIAWGEVEALLLEGYRSVAPKRAIKQLDGG